MPASRALRLIVLCAGLAVAGSAGAATTPSLVVDVESGKVLHAERATDPWFPASVTKLMTTYVALREVREGRSRLDEVVTLSENATAMPPSKMGFKPGTELTLDNALKIIMVKSANDISVAIAETLGGSVEGFADMMNVQAQRLGMRESRFVNPHGLPDERQQTSARDMAILARALILEFPEHADLFKIGAIKFGRRVMRNHNGLMGRYPGSDGMKTGFICASGFNVVASATQNGRRLITVVFGSRNANERTLKAADLFDRGFASGPGIFSPSLASLPASNLTAPPNLRAAICDRSGPMPGEDDSPTGESASTMPSLTAPTAAMAFAGTAMAPVHKTVLGPRVALNPIVPIWIGRTPPAATAAAAPAAVEADDDEDGAKPAPKARPAKPATSTAAVAPPVAAKPAPAKKPAPKAQAAIDTKPKAAAPKAAEAKKPADAKKPVAAVKPAHKPAETAKPDAKKVETKKPETKRAEVKPAAKAVAKPTADD
ncbi:D-alanyl-D-alanine carboxypeptidase family protein [Salinarimonas soli]|uniref:D-alanyl-D-alanine carboxypeptidase n=1 Tax=Salinarimonas soli TaxID=1638099 RepID=A0A5B2VAF5_9HYPH|nr:D-alanyl-D-alanine carboxypeptidase family protein [Salinarimonas soli]KAA2235708.1 D-alanyl-D-alanine carboxypeptidase [Salinarimonas soli]